MSDEKKVDLSEALATDYYHLIRGNLMSMTPSQYQVYQKAAADHAKETADTTEKDYQKSLARMSTADFERLKADIAYETYPQRVKNGR